VRGAVEIQRDPPRQERQAAARAPHGVSHRH
jgi:hypothetical protein